MLFNTKLVLFHPLVLYVIMCAVLAGFSLAILILIRWLIQTRLQGRHNEVTGYVFTAVGVIYGVLLAFVAIMVWEQYNTALSNSVVEASEALILDRDLDLYPSQDQVAQAKQALVAYVNSVIHEEFPALAKGELSPRTDLAIKHLWKTAKSFHPQDAYQQAIFQDILRDIDKLARMRIARLAAAQTNLPDIVWAVLIIGAAITLIFSSFFGAEKFWAHVVLVILLAILMASSLYLILEMDDPFMGGLSLEPAAYQEVLQAISLK
jgi:Protein of unknown function (DUF4239)